MGKKKELNFEGLARLLLSQSRDFIDEWLPGGVFKGHEYVCADIKGNDGTSFSVNVDTGKWADFATGDKGGDLISLYAAMKGYGQGDAYKDLAAEFNFEQNGTGKPMKTNLPQIVDRPESDIVPPPPGTDISNPLKKFNHRDYGDATTVWFYRDFDDSIIFAVARYETPNGKAMLPWSWCVQNNKGFWNCKGYPAPRPLYGLEQLKKHPDRDFLIVEGEKCAEAAKKLCGHFYNVFTWPNGSNAFNKADWRPLIGKSGVIWPDADKPGVASAPAIADLIQRDDNKIKILDVSDKPEGWDVADALDDGMNWAKMQEWGRARSKVYKRPMDIVTATAIAKNKENVAAAQVNVIVQTEDMPVVDKSKRELWFEMNLSLTGAEQPHINYDNVERILEKHMPLKDVVWYDDFHDKIFTEYGTGKRREWTENDDTELATYFQRELGIVRMNRETINRAVIAYAMKHPRNEPRDWMEGLKWDGEERISHFFETYFGSKHTSYEMKAAMNFWIGMIARIYRPGCKNDHMVVLEGPQGAGKSMALEIIGGPWFAVATESVQSKDFFQILQGKLLLEIAELDSFSKADVSRIKQVISLTSDRYRASYGHKAMDHPRHSVFVGSTNEDSYLKDATGGRRFWPVTVGKIDVKKLAEDREQLFAQAVLQFKQGDEWHIMPDTDTKLEQENRRGQDVYEQEVENWLREHHRTFTTAFEVATKCLDIHRGNITKPFELRITNIFRALKWRKTVERRDEVGGRPQRGWVPPESWFE